MAARTRRVNHNQKTIEKIQASQLVNRLRDHVLGKVELTASQVTAALGLLKKTLPDLAAVQYTGEVTHKDARELTRDEILAEIEALTGAAGEGRSDDQSAELH
jgi:phage-related protein